MSPGRGVSRAAWRRRRRAWGSWAASSCRPDLVGGGVRYAGLGEGPQPENARVAPPARLLAVPVARPRMLEGDAERLPHQDEVLLLQVDEGGLDADPAFVFRPPADRLLHRLVESGPAVGVAGRVGPHRADVDAPRADHLRPRHRDAEEMRVAARNVRDGD